MISVDVGLENPVQGQLMLTDIGNDFIGGFETRRPGGLVEVHHGVHDGAVPGGRVDDDVGEGVGLLVEEAVDFGNLLDGGRH